MWQCWKTQNVTKIKNNSFDKTQKLKVLQYLKAKILTRHENKIVKKSVKYKTKSVRGKKINSNCDQTVKLNFWQNLKLWIVTKITKTEILTKQNKNPTATKLKLIWQNSKTQFVTKIKNWNSNKLNISNCYNSCEKNGKSSDFFDDKKMWKP